MMNGMPRPGWMYRLITMLAGFDETETMLDDVHEEYTWRGTRHGAVRARLWLALQGVRMLTALSFYAVRWGCVMLAGHLRTGWRHMAKEKMVAAINGAGLVMAMSVCLLIYNYVALETSYDRYHKNAPNLYRTTMSVRMGSSSFTANEAPGPMAPTLKRDYDEVERAARIITRRRVIVGQGQEKFRDGSLQFVDDDFFDMFDLAWIKGDAASVKGRPHTLLITRDAAGRYFPHVDPMGRMLEINDQPYTVAGVIDNPPVNTHEPLKYRFITSIRSFHRQPETMTDWPDFFGQVFVMLKPGTDARAFARSITRIAHDHDGEYFKKRGWEMLCVLEPLTSLHLRSIADAGNSGMTLYGLTLVAALILAIACVNFVNLSAARHAERVREVGLRKVLGARRGGIISQFLGESLFLILLALLASVPVTGALLPFFNSLVNRSLTMGHLLASPYIAPLALLLIATALLAGVVPALHSSGIGPASVLANRNAAGRSRPWTRRLFIVFQFSIATVLMIASLVAYRQIRFMKTRDLGFQQQRQIYLPAYFNGRQEQVKAEFLKLPGIVSASASNIPPGYVGSSITTRRFVPELKEVVMNYNYVDGDFASHYNLELAGGRFFRSDSPADQKGAFVLNEAAVRAMGWSAPEEALGQRLEGGGHGDAYTRTVVGVVKDFNYEGLQKKVDPLVMVYKPENFYTLNLTLAPGNWQSTLADVKKQWQALDLGQFFYYRFVDAQFNALYAEEERTGRIFTAFTVLAIAISCLGLFGMAALLTRQRVKEIGIRKVMGASVGRLVSTLSKDFYRWVLIANVIAWPAGYWLMSSWLQQFAYRISLSAGHFAAAGAGAVLIAMLSVGVQVLRTARANPVEALRAE